MSGKGEEPQYKEGFALLERRLARSTLFADSHPHVHVVPPTSNPGKARLDPMRSQEAVGPPPPPAGAAQGGPCPLRFVRRPTSSSPP